MPSFASDQKGPDDENESPICIDSGDEDEGPNGLGDAALLASGQQGFLAQLALPRPANDTAIPPKREVMVMRGEDDALEITGVDELDGKGEVPVTSIRIPFEDIKGLSRHRNNPRALCVRLKNAPEGGTAGGTANLPRLFALILAPGAEATAEAIVRRWMPGIQIEGAEAPGAKPVTSPRNLMIRFEDTVLTPRDTQFLEDGEFLNDAVLDFFLRIAWRYIAPESLRRDLYVAPSLFFQQLTSCQVEDGEKGWENVKTWTNRALPDGLASRRYFAVMVNETQVHWWLTIVCNPFGEHADGEESKEASAWKDRTRSASSASTPGDAKLLKRSPRIVCLDSALVPQTKEHTMHFLRGYLQREWNEHKTPSSGSKGQRPTTNGAEHRYTSDSLEEVSARTPIQENGYDCGVFIVEYLMHLFRHPEKIGGLGLASHKHWFNQARVSHRRERMSWAAHKLLREAEVRGQTDVTKLFEDEELRDAIVKALAEPAPKDLEAAGWRRPMKRAGSLGGDSPQGSTPHELLQPRAKGMAKMKGAGGYGSAGEMAGGRVAPGGALSVKRPGAHQNHSADADNGQGWGYGGQQWSHGSSDAKRGKWAPNSAYNSTGYAESRSYGQASENEGAENQMQVQQAQEDQMAMLQKMQQSVGSR